MVTKTQPSLSGKLEGRFLSVTEEPLQIYSCTVVELAVIGWGGPRDLLHLWMLTVQAENGLRVTWVFHVYSSSPAV